MQTNRSKRSPEALVNPVVVVLLSADVDRTEEYIQLSQAVMCFRLFSWHRYTLRFRFALVSCLSRRRADLRNRH